MVCVMRKGSSSVRIAPNGKSSISTGLPTACSQSPRLPSKGSPGPVIPSAASMAAKTAERVEAAVAQPFHMDSSPLRVTANGSAGVTASEIACPILSWSNPRIRPAPQAAPITLNIPWSQPKSPTTTWSERRQNTSYASAMAVTTVRPSVIIGSARASTAGIISLGCPPPGEK